MNLRISFFSFLLMTPMHTALAVNLQDLKKSGGDALDSVKSNASKLYESGKATTGELLNKGKEKTGDLLDKGKQTAEDVYEKTKEIVKRERTSRDNRKNSFLTLNWSPFVFFSFPLPKSGFQIGWVVNETWTIDPEYLSGGFGFALAKIGIGEISDTLMSFPVRYFPGNSFNYRFGGTYRKLSAGLGDKMLSRIVNRPAHLDLLEYKYYSLNLGLGNRWQLNNGITLGADWIDLNIPLSTKKNEIITSFITNEDDKKNIKRAIDILTALQFTSIKFQIGYTF